MNPYEPYYKTTKVKEMTVLAWIAIGIAAPVILGLGMGAIHLLALYAEAVQ